MKRYRKTRGQRSRLTLRSIRRRRPFFIGLDWSNGDDHSVACVLRVIEDQKAQVVAMMGIPKELIVDRPPSTRDDYLRQMTALRRRLLQ